MQGTEDAKHQSRQQQKNRRHWDDKSSIFDIDDTIYDYIGAHNNTMPVMKEWAYENLGIAKEDLEKYVAEEE